MHNKTQPWGNTAAHKECSSKLRARAGHAHALLPCRGMHAIGLQTRAHAPATHAYTPLSWRSMTCQGPGYSRNRAPL